MFGINRRVVTIIFGVLALVFIVGSVLLFTPRGSSQSKGKVEFTVNGRPVYELDLQRAEQNDPILSTNPTGLLKNLAMVNFGERFVLTTALLQDSSRIRVSGAELNKELDSIKERFGLKDRKEYDKFLAQIGYTDSQLRDELRDQIRLNKRIQEIQDKAQPTEAEMRLYFTLYKDQYKSEDRVQARQIVVDDQKLATDLYNQAKNGADFADLAKKNSKLNADQGGALGAQAGKSDPGPVTRIVFPNVVADAVFKLKDGGITPPIEAGGRYYIVKVEKFIPAGDTTFEEVKDRVKADAQKVKAQGALEAYIDELRKTTQVKWSEGSPYKFEDPVVAKVGDSNILLSEVTQAVFSNPQVPQLLQQGLGELAVQFFMPQTLEQLVTREVVVQAAQKLGQPFFGSKSDIANQAQLWQTKDIAVSDSEAKAYYDKNIANFTTPASANVQAVNFKKDDKAKAEAFRAAALKGGKLDDLAKANGGTVQDFGTVNPGSMPPIPNRLVFLTKGSFPKGPLGEVSDVVKLDDGSYQVLIVNNRVAEAVKPFDSVKDQAMAQALAQKRSEAARKWVDDLRKNAKVENDLEKVLKALTPAKPEAKPSGEQKPSATPGSSPTTPATPGNNAPASGSSTPAKP
ncbi:peptidyl-prolyl cis-trans isomerase [Meiothermus granaticius]|uniref:peptidylprolyl isomerase n=1 Tax=Meiothermus granaticius NBRC 107808 TaxID=1227551 RepID=A0A399FB52_9DEIN|nr:peptidyl-prolyl cis-trans isomerase [Meiothermus granaticius]RIH93438.1 Foldase protein PrsA 3 [Meiothermus granaticius NBRC 107808]GEM87686.1 peptidylprolyl isomerase [Meiothermus granaticius NBRC 107808]